MSEFQNVLPGPVKKLFLKSQLTQYGPVFDSQFFLLKNNLKVQTEYVGDDRNKSVKLTVWVKWHICWTIFNRMAILFQTLFFWPAVGNFIRRLGDNDRHCVELGISSTLRLQSDEQLDLIGKKSCWLLVSSKTKKKREKREKRNKTNASSSWNVDDSSFPTDSQRAVTVTGFFIQDWRRATHRAVE